VKKFDDVIIRFDTIHERDRQPAGQTDRQTYTARQNRPRLCRHRVAKIRHCRQHCLSFPPLVKRGNDIINSFKELWQNAK